MKEVGILAAVLLVGLMIALLWTAVRSLSQRRARRKERLRPWVLEENVLKGGKWDWIVLEAVRGHERLDLGKIPKQGDNWTLDLHVARSQARMDINDLNNGVAPHKVLEGGPK